MTSSRIPVEVLLPAAGAASGGGDAAEGLLADFAMLDEGRAASRAWTCRQAAVVLGVSRDFDAEVDRSECLRRDVAVLRRSSGGGTVAIGSGTLQWAVVFPHASGEPPSLDAAKLVANGAVAAALAAVGAAPALDVDAWGDLRRGDRKVGGLAIRRQRAATLVHGTLLADADLAEVAALLRHPQREPAWRRGRSHADFLAALGAIDVEAFAGALDEAFATALARVGPP